MTTKIAPNITTVKGLAEMALEMKRHFSLDIPVKDFSLSEFYNYLLTSKSSKNRLIEFFSDVSHLQASSELFQMFTAFAWLDCGMPVFDLTHSLTSALLLTDPSDVVAEDLKFPFDCFVLRVPPGFLSVTNKNGHKQDASYAICHYTFVETKTEKKVRRLVLRLVGKSDDLYENTVVWELHELPQPGQRLADWLQLELPVLFQIKHREEVVRTLTLNEDRPVMYAFRRLFVNVCLYISAQGRGEKLNPSLPHKKNKKAVTLRTPSPDIWVIGKEVKIQSQLIAAAKSWSRAQHHDGLEWSLQSKFTVRGHWRNQPHGPGRAQRRRQWIAPHWKGEGPTKIAHLYTTAADKKENGS